MPDNYETDFDEIDGDGGDDINNPEFNEQGKNKVKAIANAGQALAIAHKLEQEDCARDCRRAQVMAAFNGCPPYSTEELIAKGQGYRYNVSFGYLEGVIGRAVVPYNQLVGNIDNLTEIEADLPEEKLSILRGEFTKIVKDWGKWQKFTSRLNQELVLFGYDTAIFPSDYDPWPVFVPQRAGFVPEGSPNDVIDLEVFVWKKTYLIHELYAKIEDKEGADKAGWNVDNVREALMGAMPKDVWHNSNHVGHQWSLVESAIRAASLYSSTVGAKVIETYHVFATEIDGKVTQYVVLDSSHHTRWDGCPCEGHQVELFKREERFDSMRDFLVYFDLEAGDGFWHGSKGLGQKAYNTHKANDRLINTGLDQVFAGGLTLLQPGDQISQEDFEFVVAGPFGILPPGIQINATAIPGLSSQFFQAQALLTATGEQRIGDITPQTISAITGTSKTATESRITAGRQELISRGNLQRYVDPTSQVLSIMLRRLLNPSSPNKDAKKFQKALLDQGFEKEDFKEVHGARSSGRIDEVLGQTAQATGVLFAEFRGDPDIDQIDLKRRRIASIIGPSEVESLLITDQDQGQQIESQRQQRLEIASFLNGIPVPASPRDNHEIHLTVVIDWLTGQLQSQTQGNPGADIETLTVILGHGIEHLGYMKLDKTKEQFSKQAKDQLDEIKKGLNDLLKQQRQAAEAQARAQQEQLIAQAQAAQLAQPQVPIAPNVPINIPPEAMVPVSV